MDAIIKALHEVDSMVYLLPFLFLFAIGYYLKEYTNLNSKLIPWVLLPIGMLLGFLTLSPSIGGVMIGAIMAWVIMAWYELIRDAANSFIGKYFNTTVTWIVNKLVRR